MTKGTVKFFSKEKGFGFITPMDGGADVFVHCTGIDGHAATRKNLEKDDKVEFNVATGNKGPKAVDVRVVLF